MRSRAAVEAVAVAALVATASGCSFVAVRRPHPVPDGAPLECTRARTAPALDLAGAIASPLVAIAVWGMCEASMTSEESTCSTMFWTGAAIGGAYTASTIYGYHHTGECRRLTRERLAPAAAAEPLRVPDPEWLHDAKR